MESPKVYRLNSLYKLMNTASIFQYVFLLLLDFILIFDRNVVLRGEC